MITVITTRAKRDMSFCVHVFSRVDRAKFQKEKNLVSATQPTKIAPTILWLKKKEKSLLAKNKNEMAHEQTLRSHYPIEKSLGVVFLKTKWHFLALPYMSTSIIEFPA